MAVYPLLVSKVRIADAGLDLDAYTLRQISVVSRACKINSYAFMRGAIWALLWRAYLFAVQLEGLKPQEARKRFRLWARHEIPIVPFATEQSEDLPEVTPRTDDPAKEILAELGSLGETFCDALTAIPKTRVCVFCKRKMHIRKSDTIA